MKLLRLLSLLVLLTQCTPKEKHDPLLYFDRAEQSDLLYKMIRYSAKLPPNSNHTTKFDTIFDDYYKRVASDYAFLKLSKKEDGSYDYLISRPARSKMPMFEGIAGQFKLNESDSLIEYNEVFRTWKLTYKDLNERGSFLFDRMVKGEDLTIFYSKTAGDKYIEFPDDRFTFDKQQRRWHDNAFDSASVN